MPRKHLKKAEARKIEDIEAEVEDLEDQLDEALEDINLGEKEVKELKKAEKIELLPLLNRADSNETVAEFQKGLIVRKLKK